MSVIGRRAYSYGHYPLRRYNSPEITLVPSKRTRYAAILNKPMDCYLCIHSATLAMRISLPLLFLFLNSCNSSSTSTETTTGADSAATGNPSTPTTQCFQLVAGRDTTRLQLLIQGSTVTGELTLLPFEKDRARGSIRGTLNKNQIQADWQRSGEGVTQPYEIVFTLNDSAVTWREGERIEKGQKWVLKNSEQAYEYTLPRTPCSK